MTVTQSRVEKGMQCRRCWPEIRSSSGAAHWPTGRRDPWVGLGLGKFEGVERRLASAATAAGGVGSGGARRGAGGC